MQGECQYHQLANFHCTRDGSVQKGSTGHRPVRLLRKEKWRMEFARAAYFREAHQGQELRPISMWTTDLLVELIFQEQ